MDGLMTRALRKAAHPEQPLFQFVQVLFEVTFHEALPVRRILPQPGPGNLKSQTAANSSKASGDVRLRPRIARRRERLRRRIELDHLACQQKCSEIADARRLLHVVRADRYGRQV